jgi:hypothetical protein
MRWRNWIHTLPLRFRSIVQRRRLDAELDEELNLHLEYLIQNGIEQGLPQDEARFAALREMGGLAQRAEECQR